MSNFLTVDASVFVNAFSPTENGSNQSWLFLKRLFEGAIPVVVPTLMLVEVVAALTHKHNNAQLGLSLMHEIQRLSQFMFVSLDESLAQAAAEIAARYRLRGSDAVYAAVAKRYAATLITLDIEQQERVAALVAVQPPI